MELGSICRVNNPLSEQIQISKNQQKISNQRNQQTIYCPVNPGRDLDQEALELRRGFSQARFREGVT